MSRIQDYYDRNAEYEWERLERHRVEFAVTLRALSDYLPSPPARILDIGGGPGRYAIALAQRGDCVTLFDLSDKCLDLAREKAKQAEVKLDAYVRGNAVNLAKFPTARFDVALLMGPLYHLIAPEERARAIIEAQRVLKSGGLMFATFITRYASIRYAALNDLNWILVQRAQHECLLETGILEVGDRVGGFTDAYFTHPTEINPLMESAGFETLGLLACEGVVSMIDRHVNMASGELWEAWVELNYRLARDPSIHGAAEHLLYVGKKA